MKILIQGITDMLGLDFEGFLPEPSGPLKIELKKNPMNTLESMKRIYTKEEKLKYE
jgi:hypothetical protein